MSIKDLLALTMLSVVVTFNLNAGITVQKPTQNGEFQVGSPIHIEWTHPAEFAGKSVNLNISLHSKVDPFNGPIVTIINAEVGLPPNTLSTGTWMWNIPYDFPIGGYVMSISESVVGRESILTPMWADTAIQISPIPAIKFSERYGETIRRGEYPEFKFTMVGAEFSQVRIFLKKEGEILGQLYSSGGYSYARKAGSFTWVLTEYLTRDYATILPKVGSDYSILVGIMRDPDKTEGWTFEDFLDLDETDRFSLEPGKPFSIEAPYHLVDGRMQLNMHVIGDIGVPYEVQFTATLSDTWEKQAEFVSASEVVRVTAFFPSENKMGFFRLVGKSRTADIFQMSQATEVVISHPVKQLF